MALEIESVSLFNGDTPKINVYCRPEYTHFKREDLLVFDEEKQQNVIQKKYYVVINICYYTSKIDADNKLEGQPFKVDQISKEITYEQYCSFCSLSYSIIKEEDFYKNCLDI